ncbi:MAG: iron complex outerrane recepter protein [Gammaproteobacteria bacterium]|nr:iron complex outerrane recepter protein [Gammaproteobacteria bacterium]
MRYYPNSNDTLTSFLTNAVVDASMRLPLVCALALVAGTAFGHTEQPGTTLLASAEPLVTSTDTGLSDVVVTATRQSTKLQETPVAVTVMTGSDLAEQNLTTARDLAGKTPGVVILRSGITPLTQTFFIRGIGESDPIFDPAIAQYVDDVYLPRAINGLSDLTDIERVEVLRGPQGTLFGDNADAGAIRYITKDPTDKTAADFDIGGGNYSAFQAHAYISGAIITGKLDGSIAFAHDQHSGYTYDPTINQHVNDQNTNGFRGKLLAKLTDELTVLLTVDGLRDNSSTAYYTPVLFFGRAEPAAEHHRTSGLWRRLCQLHDPGWSLDGERHRTQSCRSPGVPESKLRRLEDLLARAGQPAANSIHQSRLCPMIGKSPTTSIRAML